NFLNSMVTVGKPFVVFEATGTGNSPPARKRAESPDNAIRFGSASRRNTPLVSNAVTRLSMDMPLLSLRMLVSRVPYGVAPLASVAAAPSRGRLPVGLAPTLLEFVVLVVLVTPLVVTLELVLMVLPPMGLRPTTPA